MAAPVLARDIPSVVTPKNPNAEARLVFWLSFAGVAAVSTWLWLAVTPTAGVALFAFYYLSMGVSLSTSEVTMPWYVRALVIALWPLVVALRPHKHSL